MWFSPSEQLSFEGNLKRNLIGTDENVFSWFLTEYSDLNTIVNDKIINVSVIFLDKLVY